MFNNINIKDYFVYQYGIMDDLSAILSPNDVWINLEDIYGRPLKMIIKEVEALFKDNGWEGDGEIGIIWIPPFIDTGDYEDTYGGYLWHVKQQNNGTSFIASPTPLHNFKRLK